MNWKRRDFVFSASLCACAAMGVLGLPGAGMQLTAQAAKDQKSNSQFHVPKNIEHLTELEKIHVPKVTIPPVVEDGNQAPIVVKVDHPMENDHYIKTITILNFKDPIVIKGQCFFTPMSGEAYFGTQIRLSGGESRVWVISECNKHGKYAISKDVKVAAGGC